MFTKPLPQELLLQHAKALGMVFQTHMCHFCMSEFKSGNTLHSHIKSIHMAETPAGIVLAHSKLSRFCLQIQVHKFYSGSKVLFKFKNFIQVQTKVLFKFQEILFHV